VSLFPGVATEASFGNGLGIHPLERDDLELVAVCFNVLLAGTVTRFASDNLVLPGFDPWSFECFVPSKPFP
jgi:hypothetical protein